MLAKQRQKKNKKSQDLYSGFEKLAFGRITDAIRLLYLDNAPDTDEILKGLGEMYVSDERFKNNIDKAGGIGTAEFTAKAINCIK